MKASAKVMEKKVIMHGKVFKSLGSSGVVDYFEDPRGYLFCRECNAGDDARLIRCGHRSEHNETIEKFREGFRINFQYKSFTERIEATQKRKRILKHELLSAMNEILKLPEQSGKRDRLRSKIQELQQEESRLKSHIELLLIFTGDRSTDRKEEEHA